MHGRELTAEQGRVLRRAWSVWLMLLMVCGLLPWSIECVAARPARSAQTVREVPTLNATLLHKKIDAVQGNRSLNKELKEEVLNLYQLALDRVSAEQQALEQAASYKQSIASAPVETRRLRAEAAGAKAPEAKISDLPLAELQQQQDRLQATITDQRARLEQWDKQLQTRQSRPAEARTQLTAAQERAQGLTQDLKRQPGSDQPALLSEAQRIALSAQLQATNAEIEQLEQELLSHDARMELIQAQHDQLSHEQDENETRLRALQTTANEQQKAAAEQAEAAALQAERDAMNKHPAVRAVTEEFTHLTQDWKSTIQRLEQANAAREATEQQAKQMEQDFQSTRQKFQIAGLSLALGEVLREQRRKLPDIDNYQRDTRARQQEVAQVGLEALRAEELRAAGNDIDRLVTEALRDRVDPALPEEEHKRVETELRKLYRERQDLLGRLVEATTRYSRALGDLDFAQRGLIDVAQNYATFLDERLLWMPSAAPLSTRTLTDLLAAAAWLSNPQAWIAAMQTLTLEKGREQPLFVFGFGVIIVLALIGLRRKFRERIGNLSTLVAKIYTDRFSYTVEALVYTVLLAVPVPLLLALIGWRLRGLPSTADGFTASVGAGLVHISLPLFLFIALYRLCRIDGVAEDHFLWRDGTLRMLRRNLKWLISIALPSMFVTAIAGWDAPDAYRDSLGRLAFMVSMMAFTVFTARILRFKGGIFAAELVDQPGGLIARTRYLWYPTGILVPSSLAVLAALGYYYTARQLEEQLAASAWLVIGAMIVHDLVLRWFAVEQRRLAIAKAREKREAARLAAQAAQNAAENPDSTALPPIELDLQLVDLPTINEQTRRLTRIVVGMSVLVGLYFIWVQVLPALAMLDQIAVWEHTVTLDGKQVQQPITLANLALAAVITFIMLAAARNLPGVLELVVLQHLDIDAGSRYAVTQILRYAIFAAGISGAFKAIGGSWDQLQWIVAALGVGLGFGLQEIFANFISGLILLFERPIRVGDTVTISNINGTVSRIRMRTTTITDWDRRALIVPNKTFITEQLINWSLDPMTRLVVKIGVAAGTDLALAHTIIMQTARAQPKVLKEPEPIVYFMGVGEKTLNFELRVFVKELESRMPLLDALIVALHEAFLKHGVSIRIPP